MLETIRILCPVCGKVSAVTVDFDAQLSVCCPECKEAIGLQIEDNAIERWYQVEDAEDGGGTPSLS